VTTSTHAEPPRPGLHLSPRQSQILGLVAAGRSDKEIAAALGISRHTVQMHLRRLYRERDLRNRSQAVAAWMRNGEPAPAG
jgi:DNA-binding CsgD family transcriptional regulator